MADIDDSDMWIPWRANEVSGAVVAGSELTIGPLGGFALATGQLQILLLILLGSSIVSLAYHFELI